jgi:segregation and condensation protein B
MQPPKLTPIQGGIDQTDSTPSHRAITTPATTPTPDGSPHQLRIIEALLFAASEPLEDLKLASSLDATSDVKALLAQLQQQYASRGVNLVQVGGRWAFRTANDLGYLLQRHALEEKKLSKAALETLSIIAYHQPVTRAEIEDIRGVSTSKGTLGVLMETGWERPRGRRRAPGKPITYGTTPHFLDHFGLATIK